VDPDEPVTVRIGAADPVVAGFQSQPRVPAATPGEDYDVSAVTVSRSASS
jgi:hypothetical protein